MSNDLPVGHLREFAFGGPVDDSDRPDLDLTWLRDCQTITIQNADLNPEALRLLCGDSNNDVMHSLMFERDVEVPDYPPIPKHRKGLWARLTRANVRARRDWIVAYDAWVAAGQPTKTMRQRTYLPRVQFTQIPPPRPTDS